jgi:hypothetical protein
MTSGSPKRNITNAKKSTVVKPGTRSSPRIIKKTLSISSSPVVKNSGRGVATTYNQKQMMVSWLQTGNNFKWVTGSLVGSIIGKLIGIYLILFVGTLKKNSSGKNLVCLQTK